MTDATGAEMLIGAGMTAEEIAITEGDDSAPAVEPAPAEPAAEDPVETPAVEASDPPAEEVKSEEAEEKAEGQMVPLATLLEERSKAQERTEAKLAEMQTAFEAKIADLAAKVSPVEPAAEATESDDTGPMPSPILEEEKFGEWLERTLAKASGAAEKSAEETQKLAEQQRAHTELTQTISNASAAEDAFAKEKPDYFEAFAHLRAARVAEIKMFNPAADEATINAAIGQETLTILHQAQQSGVSAPEMFYQLAVGRGWEAPETPSAEEAAETNAQQEKGAVERAEAAAAAAHGVGAAQPASGTRLTAAAIANMSADDMAKVSDAEFEAAMS